MPTSPPRALAWRKTNCRVRGLGDRASLMRAPSTSWADPSAALSPGWGGVFVPPSGTTGPRSSGSPTVFPTNHVWTEHWAVTPLSSLGPGEELLLQAVPDGRAFTGLRALNTFASSGGHTRRDWVFRYRWLRERAPATHTQNPLQ